LRLASAQRRRGEPPPDELGTLDEAEAAVVAGWRAEGGGAWSELRALDAPLARIGPRHPLFADASRLRAEWRIASGNRALATQAIELADLRLALRRSPSDFGLRIRAASAAADPDAALASFEEVVAVTLHSGLPPAHAREFLRLLGDVPNPETHPEWRTAIRRYLQAYAP
jgi:hypothetical protein